MTTPTLQVTVPATLGPDQLYATDVPETEYADWVAGTTYALAARVIKNHSVWESLAAGNLGNDPEAAGSVYWTRVSATNRWKACELEQQTYPVQATPMYYEFDPAATLTAIHVLGIIGASSVRIRLTDPTAGVVYDTANQAVGRTITRSSWWEWGYGTRRLVNQLHFYDLPAGWPNARLRIDLAGGSTLGVQCIVAGVARSFGNGVQYGLRSGIDSYSKISRDDWGTPTLRKGSYSKRLSFTLNMSWSDVDSVTDFFSESDARVLLWNVSDAWRATKILGFLKSWDQLFSDYDTVDMSVELEGMNINA